MTLLRTLAPALLAVAVGCASARPHEPAPLPPLPATFTGVLPCADCAGIHYRLDLLAGGAYLQRMIYQDGRHDAPFDELGRWELARDRTTLVLDGGREMRTFWQVRDARTLRKLDLDGHPIDSALPYELTRTEDALALEPRVLLRGLFTYLADAARFRDCVSALAWPVAMTDDYPALERAYARDRARPGVPLLVVLEGRIATRPKMEGSGTETILVVERFLRTIPGDTCPDRHPHPAGGDP